MLNRLLFLLIQLLNIFRTKPRPKVQALPSFDAARYLGRWYEIKRFDHFFERGVSQARAEYTALANGEFLVTNTGTKNGQEQQFIAVAKPTDTKNFYKIFPKALPFITSNYCVAWVDEAYQYAVVTSISFDYLWFLARTPDIPEFAMEQMLTVSRQLGFDTSKLIDGQ